MANANKISHHAEQGRGRLRSSSIKIIIAIDPTKNNLCYLVRT